MVVSGKSDDFIVPTKWANKAGTPVAESIGRGLGTPLIVWGVVAEIFDPAEIVAVHLIGKTVRSFYFLGFDERFDKNFDHRKR